MDRWRRIAWGALGVLGVATVVSVAVTMPWRPLGRAVPHPVAPDAARDFTPEEIHRAEALSHALNGPAYGALAAGLVVAAALGFTPLGARLFGRLTARIPFRTARVAAAGLVMALVTALVALPFAAWSYRVRVRHGLTTQGWPAWLGDQATAFGVVAVTTVLVLVLGCALIRALPRTWFAPAAAAAFALVVGVSFVYPSVIEPLYNSFTPMRAGPLRTQLMNLARHDGVPVRDVLVADASRRTTTVNAYVSGFGATRRIVVYDTLLRTTPPAQIRLIVAHELGHAKHDDVLHGTLVGALGAAAGVCLLYLFVTAEPVRRRTGVTRPSRPGPAPGRHGSAGLADARGVALLVATVTVGTLLSTPAQNLVSRRIEARADVHSLNLTRDPVTFTRMQHALALRNLSDPEPNAFDYLMYGSHPTPPQRIALARDWARTHHHPVPPNLAPHR